MKLGSSDIVGRLTQEDESRRAVLGGFGVSMHSADVDLSDCCWQPSISFAPPYVGLPVFSLCCFPNWAFPAWPSEFDSRVIPGNADSDALTKFPFVSSGFELMADTPPFLLLKSKGSSEMDMLWIACCGSDIERFSESEFFASMDAGFLSSNSLSWRTRKIPEISSQKFETSPIEKSWLIFSKVKHQQILDNLTKDQFNLEATNLQNIVYKT